MKKDTSPETFIFYAVFALMLSLGSVWLFSYLCYRLPQWGYVPSIISGFVLCVVFAGSSVGWVACAADAIKRQRKEGGQ